MTESDYSRPFKGQVLRRAFAPGSKSAQDAICLVDAQGRSFKLRRVGGDPYADKQLEGLLGKTIAGHGRMLAGNTVLLADWEEVPDED